MKDFFRSIYNLYQHITYKVTYPIRIITFNLKENKKK